MRLSIVWIVSRLIAALFGMTCKKPSIRPLLKVDITSVLLIRLRSIWIFDFQASGNKLVRLILNLICETGLQRYPEMKRRYRPISTLIFTIALIPLFGSRTQASPIHHTNMIASASLRQSWLAQHQARNHQLWAQHHIGHGAINSASLANGPVNLQQVWEAFKSSMRFSSQMKPASSSGFLPNTPFINDLWSRRTINAARFDANHGTIAQMMDWETYFKNTPSPSSISSALKGPTVVPPASPLNPQIIIPEPSSVLIGLSMIGIAYWASRKSAKSDQI
jgi:hypothetical protein